jgi:bile acid:Na+ symporter, BASS family
MTDIDLVKVHFDPGQLQALNACLGFIMFGIALELDWSGFKNIWQTPKSALIGMAGQYLFFPLLTLGLAWIWQPAPSVCLGMALIAACPSGNIAHYAAHLSNANVPLSISLGAFMTAFAWLSTPLTFAAIGSQMPGTQALMQQFSLSPMDMIIKIAQLMLLPMILGLGFRRFAPKLTQIITKPVRWASLLLFLALIIGALAGNWHNIKDHLGKVFWLVLVLNSIALISGYLAGRAAKLPNADCRTLAFENGVHNTGLGLILIFSFFGGLGGMAVIAAWYGIWDMVTVLLLAVGYNYLYAPKNKIA